jgi:hypothetical protein
MKFRTLALAGAMVFIAGAALADDPMANTYANTVSTKNMANGQTATLLFNADMTYKGMTTGADGKPVEYTGGWSLKDGGKTICLTTNLPPNTPNAPKPSCSPLATHNVGDTWTVTNDQNETYSVSLTSGR